MSRGTQQISVPTVTPREAVNHPSALVIDLRSPSEFAEDHLPGAHNVPLFDDEERALIGTLYKRQSPDEAFAEGRRVAERKIRQLVDRIAEVAGWSAPAVDAPGLVRAMTEPGIQGMEEALAVRSLPEVGENPVVLHCWRGGLRSRSVVAFLRELGLDRAVGLEGGYKAYRRFVMEALTGFAAPRSFVLRGLTGVGKTLVLEEIEKLRPGLTVDLEGLADHRGSILGMVGREPHSQKSFDTRLARRLRAGFPHGDAVWEGESRKIGNVVMPAPVWRALRGGVHLRLETSMARRVEVIVEEYLGQGGNRAALAERLPFIESRLGKTKWKGVLVDLLRLERDSELVEVLFERYYDPLYRHSEGELEYTRSFDSTDPRRAAEEIVAWVEERRDEAELA